MYSKHSALGGRIRGINRNNDVILTLLNKHGVELAKVLSERKAFC